jgi:hypothetical protein
MIGVEVELLPGRTPGSTTAQSRWAAFITTQGCGMRKERFIFSIALLLCLASACHGMAWDDRFALRDLKEAGSDLTKPHQMEFWLSFPDRDAAKGAADEIGEMGFYVEIWEPGLLRGDEIAGWLCYAAKTMVPEYDALVTIRFDFAAIATRHGGIYEGWSTSIVR